MSDNYRRKMDFALRSRWRAEVARCQAGISLYMDHPAGIGDHPDVIGELDALWGDLATAQDKLDALTRFHQMDIPVPDGWEASVEIGAEDCEGEKS